MEPEAEENASDFKGNHCAPVLRHQCEEVEGLAALWVHLAVRGPAPWVEV